MNPIFTMMSECGRAVAGLLISRPGCRGTQSQGLSMWHAGVGGIVGGNF